MHFVMWLATKYEKLFLYSDSFIKVIWLLHYVFYLDMYLVRFTNFIQKFS